MASTAKEQKFLVHLGFLSELVFKQKENRRVL